MVIHPLQGDEASLSVSSFTTSVDALRKAAGKFSCKDMRIVSLSTNSPVTLTVEDAVPEFPALHMFFEGLESFKKSGEIPAAWSRSKIDGVLDFLDPVGKSVGRFSLSSCNGREIEVDPQYKFNFKKKIESDFSSVGTVDGMLEAVNIHGKKNTATLYPTIGNDKIICEFDDRHLSSIKEMIGSYVEIRGEMMYRWRDKYPSGGRIDSIEHINEEGLPSFSDLYGMAPNATGGVPAEDFIARVRGERE